MNWRVKALAQQLFSRVPGGSKLNLLMQTRVTRSLPAPPEDFVQMLDTARQHRDGIGPVLETDDLGSLRGFEFGAGWHLGVAVALAGLGVGHQSLVDRFPLASDEFVRITIDEMLRLLPESERLAKAAAAAGLEEALPQLGIQYLAPVDARETGLDEGSFDFVTSTSTLEHIPVEDLESLLRECFRVLRPGGAFSALIDYKDHYASFDRSIAPLNFLRYSAPTWRLYSPPLQFQNRLRHSDHVALLQKVGFDFISVSTVEGTAEDFEWLESTQIHPSFDRYERSDLAIRDAHIVCLKPAGPA